MKKAIKAVTAAITAVAIAADMIVFCLAAGYNTIKITGSQASALSYSGARYTEYTGTYALGGKSYGERAYAVFAKPNAYTRVEVTSGSSVYGRSTLSQKLSSYSVGNRRVIAAINADFFSGATGIPLGVQISNGTVQATNNYEYDKSVGRYSVAFRADGTAFTAIPNFSVTADIGGTAVTVDRVNAYPDTNLTLLTGDYSDKTYWNTAFAHDVIVLKADGALKVDTPLSCALESYMTAVTQPIAIEKDHIYLIAPVGDARLAAAAAGKEAGATSSATVKDLSGGWKTVENAVGGGNLLINGGTLRYTSTYDTAIANTMTSRSAIGIKADGSIILYTVEKDKNGAESGGVPLAAVAQALFDMGCVQAVNFDGGGSSTIAAATDNTACTVKNSCQDGYQRRISNILMLVCDETAPTVAEDFENEIGINEHYDGMSLIDVQKSENAYTGTFSLKADYRFAGDSGVLGFSFKKPYDIKSMSNITLSVCGDSSGSELYAVLSANGEEYKSKLCTLDFSGWKTLELGIADAAELRGFHIGTALGTVKAGTVYIDRLTGYRGYSLKDSTAPDFKVSLNQSRICFTAYDGIFTSGTDYSSISCTVDGKALTPTDGSFDISSISGNEIKRAELEITDIFGNRARRTLLFKPLGYAATSPYADLTVGKWDEMYIRYCTEKSVIDGFTENGICTFRGSESVTRVQFCTMLVRMMKIDIGKYANVVLPYEDKYEIPGWATLYVKAAYAEGIMLGSDTYTGISFFAQNNITRQEAACAVQRILTSDTRLSMRSEYADNAQISGWARNAVAELTAKGIFDGDSDFKFYPKRNLSRSEAAAVITRII